MYQSRDVVGDILEILVWTWDVLYSADISNVLKPSLTSEVPKITLNGNLSR